jgi:hypothetical protein
MQSQHGKHEVKGFPPHQKLSQTATDPPAPTTILDANSLSGCDLHVLCRRKSLLSYDQKK